MTSYFDDPRSRQSEELAYKAEQAARRGDADQSKALFAEAAELETAVAMDVGAEASRVRSALAVSAVSLWIRAEDWEVAASTACAFLARPDLLIEDGVTQLRSLLDRAWQTQDLVREVGPLGTFAPLEARMSGGKIGVGIAPSQAVGERRDVIAPLVIRVAEWMEGKAFRRAGLSPLASRLQLLEVPALAGSYAMRFLLVGAQQQAMDNVLATPQAVADQMIAIASVISEDPDSLHELVDDPDYARAFMRAFRDLAPDGKLVGQVDLSTGLGTGSPHRASFSPASQARITKALQRAAEEVDIAVTGTLKNVTLRGDEPKIGLDTEDGFKQYRIEKGAHDDTIGPKLNRVVSVTGRRRRNEAGELHDWADDIALLEEEGGSAQEAATTQSL